MKRLLKSRPWGWSVVAIVAVLGLVAVGCTDLSGTASTGPGGSITTTLPDGVTTTETPSTTLLATTTLPSVTTPATTPLGTASETRLSNGHIKACGIIKEVWVAGGVRKLKIDYVDFLMGAEADAAAIADGVIAPGEHVDNDYYVRNNSTKLRTFDVSNSVSIITYSRVSPIDAPDPAVSWTTFYNFWNLIGPPLPEDAGMYEGLWWIERDGNTIVKIEQQWVP